MAVRDRGSHAAPGRVDVIVHGVELSAADLETAVREVARESGAEALGQRAERHRAMGEATPILARIHGELAATFERLSEVARALEAGDEEREERRLERGLLESS